MADLHDDFKNDLKDLHDTLVDVTKGVEDKLNRVTELDFEPAVVASANQRLVEIRRLANEAVAKIKDLVLYHDQLTATEPLPTVDQDPNRHDPAGNVNEQFAPGTTDVAKPVPSDDNLISKPEPAPQPTVEKDDLDVTEPQVTSDDLLHDANGDVLPVAGTANDAKTDVLVDKEDAANSIPSPVQQEGIVVDPVQRQQPDHYPSTDQAGDVPVTIKPEAEPVRPDADVKQVQDSHGDSVDGQIDVTTPNAVPAVEADPNVSIPDAGQVHNENSGDAGDTQ